MCSSLMKGTWTLGKKSFRRVKFGKLREKCMAACACASPTDPDVSSAWRWTSRRAQTATCFAVLLCKANRCAVRFHLRRQLSSVSSAPGRTCCRWVCGTTQDCCRSLRFGWTQLLVYRPLRMTTWTYLERCRVKQTKYRNGWQNDIKRLYQCHAPLHSISYRIVARNFQSVCWSLSFHSCHI